MKAYLDFWRRCFSFKGRTTRADFCTSFLLLIFFGTLLNLAEGLVLTWAFDVPSEQAARGVLFTVYVLLSFVGCVTMTKRRLTDAGYSGKAYLWLLIPVLGGIAFAARMFGKTAPDCTQSVSE